MMHSFLNSGSKAVHRSMFTVDVCKKKIKAGVSSGPGMENTFLKIHSRYKLASVTEGQPVGQSGLRETKLPVRNQTCESVTLDSVSTRLIFQRTGAVLFRPRPPAVEKARRHPPVPQVQMEKPPHKSDSLFLVIWLRRFDL